MAETQTDEPRVDEDDKRRCEWRRACFEEYGFIGPLASLLAEERAIDHWLVKKMLDQGCSHNLILRILL